MSPWDVSVNTGCVTVEPHRLVCLMTATVGKDISTVRQGEQVKYNRQRQKHRLKWRTAALARPVRLGRSGWCQLRTPPPSVCARHSSYCAAQRPVHVRLCPVHQMVERVQSIRPLHASLGCQWQIPTVLSAFCNDGCSCAREIKSESVREEGEEAL